MAEFEIPNFLIGQDADTIHKRMMDKLPSDIDKTEAGFPWDFTRPTALEVAELLEFFLPETLKLMFPQFAYGEWLDLHAEQVGLKRRSARYAIGKVYIEGKPGIKISKGFLFAVPANGDITSIEFETTEDIEIGNDGTAIANVEAVEPGVVGNVAANTIVIMSVPIKEITSVTNPEHISGGTKKEDDESLRERIKEYYQNIDSSFVGCDADYIRWAKAVDGVGTAFVIPEWDPDVPNSVKVVVMDANGEPANEAIVKDVYNYIMSPDNRLERKAPIGAIVTIDSPEILTINISFKIVCENGYSVDLIIEQFKKNLQKYYVEAKEEKEIKYSRIGAILSDTAGVDDYFDLKINSGINNIEINEDEYPVTGEVLYNG